MFDRTDNYNDTDRTCSKSITERDGTHRDRLLWIFLRYRVGTFTKSISFIFQRRRVLPTITHAVSSLSAAVVEHLDSAGWFTAASL